MREILLFFSKNNIEAWIRFLEILFKGLGYHPMSCNPNRDCRVWDHTGSRLLLHRKMAGFQTVGRIPTVAYLASNGIHRASVRLTNIKATLMLFRGNKAIGKGNQTLDQSILGYCRNILHQKAQLFWRKKDGEWLNKKWTGIDASCLLANCEMIYGKIAKRMWIRLAIFFIDSNLIWSLELILK